VYTYIGVLLSLLVATSFGAITVSVNSNCIIKDPSTVIAGCNEANGASKPGWTKQWFLSTTTLFSSETKFPEKYLDCSAAAIDFSVVPFYSVGTPYGYYNSTSRIRRFSWLEFF
jgi:hypothetical protein